MRKFESSQKDESRAQSADSSKAYRKPRAFIWHWVTIISFLYLAQAQLRRWLQHFQITMIAVWLCFSSEYNVDIPETTHLQTVKSYERWSFVSKRQYKCSHLIVIVRFIHCHFFLISL